MRLAMTNNHVNVTMSEKEYDLFRQKFANYVKFNLTWDDRSGTAKVTPALTRRGSAVYRDRPDAADMKMSWQRENFPYEGKRLPYFGSTGVTFTFVKDEEAMVIQPPPEEQRNKVLHRKRPVTAPKPTTATATSPNTVRIMDTLEQLRTYVRKLNEVRGKHPENITFKVKADGTLGFEFLADE